MGFKIGIESEEVFANEDRRWLGARKGADTCRSITLDPTLFADEHTAEKGAIPSGTALAEAPSGLYGPYTAGDADLGTFAGLLFNTTAVKSDAPIGSPLFWEGIVKMSFLPTFDAVTAGTIDDAAPPALGDGGTQIRWEA